MGGGINREATKAQLIITALATKQIQVLHYILESQ